MPKSSTPLEPKDFFGNSDRFDSKANIIFANPENSLPDSTDFGEDDPVHYSITKSSPGSWKMIQVGYYELALPVFRYDRVKVHISDGKVFNDLITS